MLGLGMENYAISLRELRLGGVYIETSQYIISRTLLYKKNFAAKIVTVVTKKTFENKKVYKLAVKLCTISKTRYKHTQFICSKIIQLHHQPWTMDFIYNAHKFVD